MLTLKLKIFNSDINNSNNINLTLSDPDHSYQSLYSSIETSMGHSEQSSSQC